MSNAYYVKWYTVEMSRVNFWILILDLTFKYEWITFDRVIKVQLKNIDDAIEEKGN